MRPIPTSVLSQSMAVYLRDDSGYGGSWKEPVGVSHIRLDKGEGLAYTGYKLSNGASGRVYVDAVNSKGAFAIPVGSKVVIEGEKYEVVACNEYREYSRIHHWELDVK